MRTVFILGLFITCFLAGNAQSSIATRSKTPDYKYVYYLNTDLASVKKEDATVVGRGLYEKKLFRLDCYSAVYDRLLMTLHFKDSTLADLEGPFKSYYSNGSLEKEGNFVNGVEEGSWNIWGLTYTKIDSIVYAKGVPWFKAHFQHHKNGKLSYCELNDSLKNTLQVFTYDENGKVLSDVFFKGNRGILKVYKDGKVQTDSVFTREENEAEFPGADYGWFQFLSKNLNPNVASDNGAPSGKYTVIIKFAINTDGTVVDLAAETSLGFGMEAEALRVMQKCPNWIPANQYGRRVKAFRRQPITFVVEKQ